MRRAFIISTQHWMTSTASRIARHSDPARVKGALRQSEHARLESTDGGNPNVRVVDSRAFPGSKRRYSAEDGASKARSEAHKSEIQSLMRLSYAVFCLKKKNNTNTEKSTIK